MTRLVPPAVFLHVPKTAGTSVHRWLERGFGADALSPRFDARPLSAERAAQLGEAPIVSGHLSWRDANHYYPERAFFTFLRDPIERGLSWLRFAKALEPTCAPPRHSDQFRNDPDQAIALAHALAPHELLNAGHPHVEQNLRNRLTHQLAGEATVERRASESGELVDLALVHLEAMRFVGFVERIEQDLPALGRALGLRDAPADVPVENATRRDAASPADDSLRADLASRMSLDQDVYTRARERFARTRTTA